MKAIARQSDNSRLIRRLLFIVVGMFLFGFALVPIYSVFCKITGFNGKIANTAETIVAGDVDESRTVSVEFVANVNENMPWEFRPAVNRMQVHPGAVNATSFYARNTAGHIMIGQAIPSVTPGAAALHFSKTECFCFTRQRFDAGQGLDMPVRFVVDRELPKEITTLTLSYTFFDVTAQAGDRL